MEHPVLWVYHCHITRVFLWPFWAILGRCTSDAVHLKCIILFADITSLNNAVTSHVTSCCTAHVLVYHQRPACGHQLSPRCRICTSHRCPTRCCQRPGTLPYSPKVAPWGWDGWAASSHAWGGHRSWCPLSPSLQPLWQFCHNAKHQNVCPVNHILV